ncbi:MAG TPA: trypsin-like peptidase domain-containing protein [Ktedonobacterales bacterium]|nr:trypsin-like peptidase domain-containing protein [Ktedonobacterales bacterium]
MTTPDTAPHGAQDHEPQRMDGPTVPETPSQPYQPYQPYQTGPTNQAPYQAPPAPPARREVTLRMSPWLAALMGIVLLLSGLGAGIALANAGARNTQSAIGTSQSPTLTLPPAAQDMQQQVINVISVTQPSVVQVQSQGAQGAGVGSGEIVSADGYIVTNDHVVRGFSQYAVLLSNGKTYPAQVVGEAPQDDLAVIKINATGLRPIAFGDSSKVVVGQFAVALGSPLGLQQSATFGIVSALNRSASEAPSGPAGELTGLIQTSAPINPGNSGGALVDLTGALIGVPTLGAVDPNSGGAANGIGFAISSNRVKFVADQLIKYGELRSSGQGFLGIRGSDVTPQIAQAYNLGADSGVLISGFAQSASGSSPAQQAGLREGDIITAVNGKAVNGNSDLASILLPLEPGTKVTITYVRGSATNTATVTLGERPATSG